jgi:hypothetical protein
VRCGAAAPVYLVRLAPGEARSFFPELGGVGRGIDVIDEARRRDPGARFVVVAARVL